MNTRIGRYQVLGRLGAGAFGEVLCAALEGPMGFSKRFAIKRLHPDRMGMAGHEVQALINEARLGALLHHHNIVETLELARDEDAWYVVMEFVDGWPLKDLLEDLAKRGERLPPQTALELVEQLCRGLHYAHELRDSEGEHLRLVHRDLKPANLMLSRDGLLKIMDFGIAKALSNLGSATASGAVKGSPAYMSPEQARGERDIDLRSDIFAVGALTAELLTGERLFQAEGTLALMMKVAAADTGSGLAELDDLVPGSRAVVGRALRVKPEERWPSAADLGAAVRELRAELPAEPTVADFAAAWSSEQDTMSRADLGPLSQAEVLTLHRLAAPPLTQDEAGARTAGRRGPFLLTLAGVALLMLLGAVGLFRLERDAALPDSRTEQLSFDTGAEFFPALAPDGSSLIYSKQLDKRWRLLLRRVGGEKDIPLIEDPAVEAVTGAWSPDGQRIAWAALPTGGIHLMGATGEAPTPLTESGFHPAWSPDGTTIAYSDQLALSERSGTRAGALRLADTATGAVRTLVDNGLQPSWSPDGERVVFWKRSERGPGLFTVAAAGGEPVALLDDASADWNPVWGPRGRWIYFLSDRGGGMDIWRLGTDRSGRAARGEPQRITNAGAGAALQLSRSADGRRLAYTLMRDEANVQRLPFDPETGELNGPGAWLTRGSRPYIAGPIAPDGRTMIVESFGVDNDLFLLDLGSGEKRPLAHSEFQESGARWMPDGASLVFRSDRSGASRLWTVRVDGTGLEPLDDAQPDSWHSVDWSPDGARLLVHRSGAVPVLLDGSAPLVAQEPKPLPDETLGIRAASWSPDGSRLAAERNGELLLIEAETGRVDPLKIGGYSPSWMPDGRRLLYTNTYGLFLLDTVSGESRELLDAFPYGPGAPRMSPDGRSIFLSMHLQEADIWLLEFDTAP